MHDEQVPLSEVKSVELLDTLPNVEARTGGYGGINIRYGEFRLTGLGKGRLYVDGRVEPCVFIRKNDDSWLIFNVLNDQKTRDIHEQLRAATGSSKAPDPG